MFLQLVSVVLSLFCVQKLTINLAVDSPQIEALLSNEDLPFELNLKPRERNLNMITTIGMVSNFHLP